MSVTVKAPDGEQHELRFGEAFAELERTLPAGHPALEQLREVCKQARDVLLEWSEHDPEPRDDDRWVDAGELAPLLNSVGDWMRGVRDWSDVEAEVRAFAWVPGASLPR